jgi:Fur family ferric uptake transcriptional regulator
MIESELLDKFKDALKVEGLKTTPQRIAVLEEILNNNEHRESEDIYMAIKGKKINVSRATVYRTLDILVKSGFARKMNLGEGSAKYESKIDSPHHDHLICSQCNDIIEFVNNDIERIQDEIAKKFQFKLQKHIHQLFGICKKCQ